MGSARPWPILRMASDLIKALGIKGLVKVKTTTGFVQRCSVDIFWGELSTDTLQDACQAAYMQYIL